MSLNLLIICTLSLLLSTALFKLWPHSLSLLIDFPETTNCLPDLPTICALDEVIKSLKSNESYSQCQVIDI